MTDAVLILAGVAAVLVLADLPRRLAARDEARRRGRGVGAARSHGHQRDRNLPRRPGLTWHPDDARWGRD